MYSPRIYENQIPCLYHAARNLDVPMTQLANAFVYYGLISGYYGLKASELLPQPNQVIPAGIKPQMQIFHPEYHAIRDYMWNLPPVGTLNTYFQTMKDLTARDIPQIQIRIKQKEVAEDELVPF
jgi:hypothetical protein